MTNVYAGFRHFSGIKIDFLSVELGLLLKLVTEE
jgi:hypothetical protein